MRKLLALFAVAVVLLGAVAAQAASVSMMDNSFSPATVTINAGDSVTWTNNGAAVHTATADNGSFDSGNRAPGQSYSHTFNSAGTFPYYCTLHGGPGGAGMAGRVIVRAQAAQGSSGQPPSAGGGGLAQTGIPWALALVAVVFTWYGRLLIRMASPKRAR